MVRTDGYRQLVTARAGGACEYCRLVEAACGVTFHIEHIMPLCLGGETILSNLALSCPGCNLAKSDQTFGVDEAGNQISLFNPRNFQPSHLGWHLHFLLDRSTGVIAPHSPVGEITLKCLAMNATVRVFARKLQIEAGLIG